MSETVTERPPGWRRFGVRRWLVSGLVVAVLAGTGVAIVLATTGGSPSSQATPAAVTAWLQANPDVAMWMQDHPAESTWMRQHWSEMQWMRSHWTGMAWLHAHPGTTGGAGMMGSMPMAGSFPEMRQWMSGNGAAWMWMQEHWTDMSWWMGARWTQMQWLHDHWNASG